MSEFSEYISKIRGVNFEDEDIMHVRDSRTDEPASSPQEPVVHQSCDQQTNSEQSGVFVQGGMEPPVRKAVDVHQSAAIAAKQFLNWIHARRESDRVWTRFRGVDYCTEGSDPILDDVEAEFKKLFCEQLAQVEQEAKRAAAD